MKTNRTPLLAAALVLLVVAAPAAACLAAAHAPQATLAHRGCGESPDAPSAALCADMGSGVTAHAPMLAAPVAGADSRVAVNLSAGGAVPGRGTLPVPRARSAPIHLLHATFLI